MGRTFWKPGELGLGDKERVCKCPDLHALNLVPCTLLVTMTSTPNHGNRSQQPPLLTDPVATHHH